MQRLAQRPDWHPRFADDHPAFAPIRHAAEAFVRSSTWPPVDDYAAALIATGSAAQVRFETQLPKAGSGRGGRATPIDARKLYDGRIVCEGVVPTRPESWHDFFNMLVWATYPRAKHAVHVRQHAALAARLEAPVLRLPGARTREQDALAMLDEGGLLLLCADGSRATCDAAVRDGDARALLALVEKRAVAPVVFGHAMFEHVVAHADGVRASPVVLAAGDAPPAAIDAQTALADVRLAELLARADSFAAPSRAPGVLLVRELFA